MVTIYFLFSNNTNNTIKIPTGDHDGQLMPGIYEYPFSFRLLCKSPCSFEGEYGHIRYTIKAVVVRNICKSNYETERNFVVPSVVNLNAIKGAGVC